MPPLVSLQMLKIPVTDIEEAAAFYRDVLGFQQEYVLPEYGWAQLKIGDLLLALYRPGMGGGDRRIGGSVDFHLAADEIETLYERFVALAAHVPDGILTGNDGSVFFDVHDPDGNIIKFIQVKSSK